MWYIQIYSVVHQSIMMCIDITKKSMNYAIGTTTSAVLLAEASSVVSNIVRYLKSN